MDITKILEQVATIYGILALIVKVCPTIPKQFPWLVALIKLLGKITNNQTDDEAIRKVQK